MKKSVTPKNLKCIRCGVCCISAPCHISDVSDGTEICSYLTIHKEGYASCRYIEENGNPFSGGCFLRHSKEVYELYKEGAERKVGIKLVGIKTASALGT